MHLRDHPLMHSGSSPNWPPVWTRVTKDAQVLTGEIGILKKVVRETDRKCCLLIDHEGGRYFGSLVFDDAMFCQIVQRILKDHIDQAIDKIGDVDLSFTL
jgi:hypothetical protein